MYEIRNSGSECSEAGSLLFLRSMKLAVCLQVPRALRLIEDHDVLDWRAGIDQRVITKMVNILDERFHALANFPFPHFLALLLAACDFVARQRFAKHSD